MKHSTIILYVPTLALLEIKYLFEVGKLKGNIADFTHYIKRKTNILMDDFGEGELREALLLKSTRDPFDGIILSTAISMDFFILTKDKWLQKKYSKTIW